MELHRPPAAGQYCRRSAVAAGGAVACRTAQRASGQGLLQSLVLAEVLRTKKITACTGPLPPPSTVATRRGCWGRCSLRCRLRCRTARRVIEQACCSCLGWPAGPVDPLHAGSNSPSSAVRANTSSSAATDGAMRGHHAVAVIRSYIHNTPCFRKYVYGMSNVSAMHWHASVHTADIYEPAGLHMPCAEPNPLP